MRGWGSCVKTSEPQRFFFLSKEKIDEKKRTRYEPLQAYRVGRYPNLIDRLLKLHKVFCVSSHWEHEKKLIRDMSNNKENKDIMGSYFVNQEILQIVCFSENSCTF